MEINVNVNVSKSIRIKSFYIFLGIPLQLESISPHALFKLSLMSFNIDILENFTTINTAPR